jgi:outer membrane protein assembly factor BamB
LIDPYGIYGTRTANRMRAARRRRQTQNIILFLLLLGVAAAVVAFGRLRNLRAIKSSAELDLLTPIVSPPVRAVDSKSGDEALLLATTGGSLLRLDKNWDANTEPVSLLQTEFAVRVPLVSGDKAFVPSESGWLLAVNWRSGKVLWRCDLQAPLATRPILVKLITAQPQAQNIPAPTTPPRPVAAVVRTPASSPLPQPPTPRERQAVIVSAGEGLTVALDATNGKPLWKTRLPSPPGDALAAVDSVTPRVLVPLLGSANMRGGVWCLDAGSGKVLWKFPSNAQQEAVQIAPPVVDGAAHRVFFANDLGAIFSLDAASGKYDPGRKTGWKQQAVSRSEASPAISFRAAPLLFFGDEPASQSTRLVVGASDGGVRCYNSNDGTLLWKANAGAPVAALHKTRRDGRDVVLVVTRSSLLILLDAGTGKILRRFRAGGDVAGAIIVDDEVVAVSTTGTVERFELS